MARKDLPSPSSPNFLARVREEIHALLGKTGSERERALTLQDAIASGVIATGPGGSLVPGPGAGADPYEPDLTPPPTPDGLTATPAISHILLEVPAATYTQGHGHLRTRVYGVTRLSGDPAPVFADAVEVGQFSGTVWAFPSNPSTTWHLWAKWESVDGVLSASPVGGTNGVVATTGQDVSSLLDALAGQIAESQLYNDLASRIDLIDGPSSLSGSVAQRVAAEANTRATETGELFAKYTIKVDVAGHVSGYGLASTANNGAVVSQFGIRADQFFVAPPSVSSATAPSSPYKGMVWVDTSVEPSVTRYYTGSSWSTTPQALPFVVQTTPTTINGETVPPGVYLENAYMARLVATRGQIGLLVVDDARIASVSVDKLTAGSIAVGQYAQSTGYVAGSSGWRINGDGTAEFSGVVVRGTIFASQGAIGGWTIGSNYLQSTTYVLGTSGTRFNSDGTGQIGGITIYAEGLGAGSTAYDTGAGAWIGRDGRLSLRNSSGTQYLKWDGSSLQISGALQAATGTFAGSLSAATGSFAGSLNAATGTFSGSLTASAVNAVNTINLAGQAVTIPVGAYTDGASSQASSADRITVQSVTFMSTGAPVFVAGAFSYTGNSSCTGAYLRIYRNGSEIVKFLSRCAPGDGGSISGLTIDTPVAGPVTYSIVLSAPAGIATSYNRSMFAMEVKR